MIQNLADPIYHAARFYGNRTAIVAGAMRTSFDKMADRCGRIARIMFDLDLEVGDRIAILSLNSQQYIEMYMALPAAGFAIVPLNTRHKETELSYVLKDSGAKVLLTDRDPGNLASLVEHVISIPQDYERLLAEVAALELGCAITPNTIAGLFYTGGTTGHSKGVMLTHKNLIANSENWNSIVEPQADDVFGVIAPLFHAAGSNSIISSIYSGGTQVVIPQFISPDVLDVMENTKITQTLVVPSMLASLAQDQIHKSRNLSNLRTLAHGGSPITTAVIKEAIRAFPSTELIHLYGTTETSPLATSLRNEEDLADTGLWYSCGQALPGVDIRVIDKDGGELADSEVGQIAIAGANVMKGYWNKPEATAEVIMEDGGFRTGDLGKLTSEGYLSITGRVKSQFKLENGKYVSPSSLEENLKLSPLVEQCVLDGRDMRHTFLIIHPSMDALRAKLKEAGITASDDNEALCNDQSVREWLLEHLKTNNMTAPKWKGYEIARHLILDASEWTTDNDMLTPSMKVKLRNLLAKHKDEISNISS
ncbi:MAG TPA: long-chain fatty acid--CoA ligase [Candidatus Poseidoniales archaeon]|nr:MAG TPA: long-chain fatty acid--CoA ligase [Candidatus Poseidoniales archaeon]